jgi:hypothetical protein
MRSSVAQSSAMRGSNANASASLDQSEDEAEAMNPYAHKTAMGFRPLGSDIAPSTLHNNIFSRIRMAAAQEVAADRQRSVQSCTPERYHKPSAAAPSPYTCPTAGTRPQTKSATHTSWKAVGLPQSSQQLGSRTSSHFAPTFGGRQSSFVPNRLGSQTTQGQQPGEHLKYRDGLATQSVPRR